MSRSTTGPRFAGFVAEMNEIARGAAGDDEMLAQGEAALASLIRHDDWLSEVHARSLEGRYAQYLLHHDPSTGLTIFSFVWGPGQETPIHDHGTWGLVGTLRGTECSEVYELCGDGTVRPVGEVSRSTAGEVCRIMPGTEEIHRVWNPSQTQVAISIHVYGRDISAFDRTAFDPGGGQRPFRSQCTPAGVGPDA